MTSDHMAGMVRMDRGNYVTCIHTDARAVDGLAWDSLLAQQDQPTPFMRHAYLSALQTKACAIPQTGWTPHYLVLQDAQGLLAACPVYTKMHSYGEYVFDFAWANAYQQHGLAYYPKALVAVPFTPVPGTRLLARNASAREALVRELLAWTTERELSSLHILFSSPADQAACTSAGLMQRQTVQFHRNNRQGPPVQGQPYSNFEDFLTSLSQVKRKKIRQERRKVAEAGIGFRHARGEEISEADWDFFYTCYERTYWEHGNAPYLSRAFFRAMADHMPEHWIMFVAEREGRPIAASLVALQTQAKDSHRFGEKLGSSGVAYGRYWGATEHVDCLHFEACYYQPLIWCIENGFTRFEGGAQGEHKMARALMPVSTHSAHWLAHPAFADAVEQFLQRESEHTQNYLEELGAHSPFRTVI